MDQRVKGWPSLAGRVVAVATTKVLVVRTEQAGTASRPLRVQAGQADLVEAVDHGTDGVLVRLDLPPAVGSDVTAHPIATAANPANHPCQSTSWGSEFRLAVSRVASQPRRRVTGDSTPANFVEP